MIILEDVDFELELIHRDVINVQYILTLLAQLYDADESEGQNLRKLVLDSVAGEDGYGLPFNLWAEDSDNHITDDDKNSGRGSTLHNDMTTRGPEGSARQYYAIAKLLRGGEFSAATAVEESTWGNIKSSFSE